MPWKRPPCPKVRDAPEPYGSAWLLLPLPPSMLPCIGLGSAMGGTLRRSEFEGRPLTDTAQCRPELIVRLIAGCPKPDLHNSAAPWWFGGFVAAEGP